MIMNYYIITETNWAKLRDEILNLEKCCHKAFGEKVSTRTGCTTEMFAGC